MRCTASCPRAIASLLLRVSATSDVNLKPSISITLLPIVSAAVGLAEPTALSMS